MSTTHSAIVSPAAGAPLQMIRRPDPPLGPGQVRVRNTWVATSLFDLHQYEGLGAIYPQILGLNAAGTVVEIGTGVTSLSIGDEVIYFGYANSDERTYQELCVVDEDRVGRRPGNVSAREAVTVPDNLVTTFHAISSDLRLDLPWPIPDNYVPEKSNEPILIWGGASSVGQYAVQVLRHYNYRNIWTTASAKQHEYLKSLGARYTFDYRDEKVIEKIHETLQEEPAAEDGRDANIAFILDCISARDGSLTPLSKIAKQGATVAALLPVVLRSPGVGKTPEYSQDVDAAVQWEQGVNVIGTRTFQYTKNEFLKKHLQPKIMPALLEQGVVLPNRHRVVEGKDALERAQNAINLLKGGSVSGERLVWEY